MEDVAEWADRLEQAMTAVPPPRKTLLGTVTQARGEAIDGSSGVEREVIAFRGDIEQGNSGGPLLTPGGAVLGMVFGASLGDASTGYAISAAELCIFHRDQFDEFAADHPDLQQKLLRRTLGELDRARRWMLLLGRKSASEKVASFLLEMAVKLAALNKTYGEQEAA